MNCRRACRCRRMRVRQRRCGRCRIVETASGEAVDAALFVRAALPQRCARDRSRGDRRGRHLDDRAERLHRARVGAADDIVIEEIEA